MPSLYQRLVDAGVPVSSWQSDLYFPVNETTKTIVAQCIAEGEIKGRPGKFRSAIDGAPMFDAPFQYQPYWDRCQRSQIRG